MAQKAGATACLSTRSTTLQFHISNVERIYICVPEASTSVFKCTMSSETSTHGEVSAGLRCSVIWFHISEQSFATGCNICVSVCVCAVMYSASVAVCVFFISLGSVCVVCEMEGEGRLYFRGHISPLPSAQDFLSYDLICFIFTFVLRMLSAFYDIKYLCQRGQD